LGNLVDVELKTIVRVGAIQGLVRREVLSVQSLQMGS